MRTELAGVRTELGAAIAGVQIELHRGIGGVQKQLQGLFFKLAALQLTTIGVVAALVTAGSAAPRRFAVAPARP